MAEMMVNVLFVNYSKLKIRFFCAIMLAFVLLSGCAVPKEPIGAVSAAPEHTLAQDTETVEVGSEKPNMVDERFELLSLVFRLAQREEYCDKDTEYQKKLESEFDPFKKHEAVKYASKLPLGYDAVFKFSVHILKDEEGFVFIEDIDSLLEDGRWTLQSASDFLTMLNNFYLETKFGAFYQSHVGFYEAETQRFIEQTYSAIDTEWFRTYVDPANLRCVYAPSSTRNNYSATVNGSVVYCAVSGGGSAVIHEFCHSFANPIAHKWYEENPEFKKWCDETVNLEKLPNYTNGKTIAGEYVTRAYNVLYFADHGYTPLPHIFAEKANGFTHIENVYAMITPHEIIELGDDIIESILGVGYKMGPERSYSIGSRVFRWKLLSLEEPLPGVFQPTEVGNIFGSKTGDVLYVEDSGTDTPYLLIDLGETEYEGRSGYSMYCRIPLE